MTNSSATVSLQIRLSGSSYSPELDKEIAKSIPSGIALSIQGEKAPAAGPELLVSLFISCARSVLVDYALGKLLDTVVASIARHIGHKPVISNVVCRTPSVEINVIDLSFLDERLVQPEWSNIDQIAAEANTLVKTERSRGRHVVRVTTPCEVVRSASQTAQCKVGSGNTACWLVEYSDKILNPTRAYDSRNSMFVELGGITYPPGF